MYVPVTKFAVLNVLPTNLQAPKVLVNLDLLLVNVQKKRHLSNAKSLLTILLTRKRKIGS